VKRNDPAEIEEQGVTAAAVRLAGEGRTAEPAYAGTEVALNDGMPFEQDPRNLHET
jgi:hypothetical protein